MMPHVGAMQNGMQRQLALRRSSGKSCQRAVQMWVSYPMHPLLGSWEARRYDFHLRDGPLPEPLRPHQEHQQDALRHSWTGLIAGTDGGVKWHDERMSAGYVVGADLVPVEVLAVRVGGPLSTLRAEAAGLLQLLLACLSEKQQAPLLVFIDNLVLLDILQKWGKASVNPRPNDPSF
jgi:hypothetical protein